MEQAKYRRLARIWNAAVALLDAVVGVYFTILLLLVMPDLLDAFTAYLDSKEGLWPYHNTIDVVLLLAVSAFAFRAFKWLYSWQEPMPFRFEAGVVVLGFLLTMVVMTTG